MKAYVRIDSEDVRLKTGSLDLMMCNMTNDFISLANRVTWDNLKNTVAFVFSSNIFEQIVLPRLKMKKFEIEVEKL